MSPNEATMRRRRRSAMRDRAASPAAPPVSAPGTGNAPFGAADSGRSPAPAVLGPYELHYDISLGYSADRSITVGS